MGENDFCKVVLVGESGVGKTCIINQFLEKKFAEKEVSTTGASYSTIILNIDKAKVKFELWDTVGQERFRSLTRLYYKDASVAIIVCDITKSSTFKEARTYWALQIADHSPNDIIIAIALNKSDLEDQEQVNEKDVKEFAKGIGAIYQKTSAKNSQSVMSLFKNIGREYLKNIHRNSYQNYLRKSYKLNSTVSSISNISECSNKCCQ